MFLAFNEVKYAKSRYALVIGVIFLVAYLVFFLTGLSYGLAQEYQTAVHKWQADYILMADDSNNNINISNIDTTHLDSFQNESIAPLLVVPAIVSVSENAKKIDVSFFGINFDSFLKPNIIEGSLPNNEDEAVVDDSLRTQNGLKIGDLLSITGSEKKIKISGFTDNAKFSVTPVVYTSIEEAQQIKYGGDKKFISAFVSTQDVATVPSSLTKLKTTEFISSLPGYSAQVLTFGFMIGFLIIITSVIIGIFIYILTMQKAAVFGVMKAQGISSKYISKSIVAQTFILSTMGIAFGLLMVIVTSFLLPVAVPFQLNVFFLTGYSILMILVALLGGVFSVRAITKIDPLKEIG